MQFVHTESCCSVVLSWQVAALCSAGGEQNLIMLDRNIHRPLATGTVGWAGSTFGPMHKSRLGEHEFEALMRTLDNLVSLYNLSNLDQSNIPLCDFITIDI